MAVFANGGFRINAYLIDKIYLNGVLVDRAAPAVACTECVPVAGVSTDMFEAVAVGGMPHTVASTASTRRDVATAVISPSVAYQITSMMQDVIRNGTARRARSLHRDDLAGKTGTTNDHRDAWFSGFNRDIVCTVWVGFDDDRALGRNETGSRAALPMWIDFMQHVLHERPETGFYKPDDIVAVRINTANGLLAHPADENAITETFRVEYLPKDIAAAPAAHAARKHDSTRTLF